MQTEVVFQDNYAMLKVGLEQGEELKAEPGAMVGMSANINMEVRKSGGGFLKSLKSKVLGGESFFNTFFTSTGGQGELLLAPRPPGSILEVRVGPGQGYILEKGAYLAAEPGVALDTKFQGLKKGFFSKEGFFLIKVEGQGRLMMNCFGGLYRVELAEGQRYIIDNGHLVAFSEATRYEVKPAKGVLGSVFSGEGLVLEFTGPGEVFLQSRNGHEFGGWVLPFLPFKKSGISFGGGDD